MCNLYSITTNQEAIRAVFRVVNRYVGNLPPMAGVFADYPAPVVRNAGAEREMMRWGMPPPPRAGGFPVTNIRNTTSPHWRGWLKPESRCLVPANSFAEYAPEPNPATGKKDVVWFALNDDRPLFAFGGLWTESKGAQSTREDKFGSYWALDKLLKGGLPGNPCDAQPPSQGSSLLLEADLGIAEWLTDSLQTENFLPSSALTAKADSTFQQDYLSYHIKFIIISNGNITPTWKLVRLSTGNGSLPLASASRTRTHDLLITFGPAFKANGANLAFSSHAAQEFGIAVSNGNRTVLSPLINP
jgi:hypothetical protein